MYMYSQLEKSHFLSWGNAYLNKANQSSQKSLILPTDDSDANSNNKNYIRSNGEVEITVDKRK